MLLFCKAFHWLVQSRVEHIEQTDNTPRSAHARLTLLVAGLLASDVLFLGLCAYFCVLNGPSVLILFGFEYAILAVAALSTMVRYVLHLIDMHFEGQWQSKGAWLFFVDFATEVARFFFYLIFFSIVFTYYGMPIHIVRELWVSFSTLRRRLAAYHRYRLLTANMNERFPDATEDELDACGRVCIICREPMDVGKKLPCGHIFHFQCLRLLKRKLGL